MTLDRDGRRVAGISGGALRGRALDTGDRVATLRGHDSPVSAVALSEDGTRLFALHGENSVGERTRVRVSVWDLKTAHLVFTLQPPDAILLGRVERVQSGSVSGSGDIEFKDGRLSVSLYPAEYTFDGRPVQP